MTGVAIGQVKILEKNNEISSENKKRFDDIVLKFMGNEKGKDFSMHNYCFNMDNQQKFALIKEFSKLVEDVVLEVVNKYKII